MQFTNIQDINWGKASSFLKEEGFYIFGGRLSDGAASNELWVLKCDKDKL